MDVYTYSSARQNLATVLDQAKKTGRVIIKRRDGSLFSLVPEEKPISPLDVEGLNSGIKRQELLDIIRESREA